MNQALPEAINPLHPPDPLDEEETVDAVTSQPSSARTVPTEGGAEPDPEAASTAGPAGPGPRAERRPLLVPGWFASVMGTGIVGNAAVTLPGSSPGLRAAATVVWSAAALLLLVLTACYVRQRALRLHAADPMQVQFFGAPAMALLTVGAGAVQLGGPVIGARAALDVDWVLWPLGTALGFATACTVPYLMVTRHRFGPDAAFGGWLMPVVPALVSATTGAVLVPHAPPGQPRLALLLGCYAMFGLGLLAVLLVLTMLYSRMVHHEAPTGAVVPTVWIGLGALGQMVTGLGVLANVAPGALSRPYAQAAGAAALFGGLAVWGFAVLWLTLATALTVREFRAGRLPFATTWWSFIFPLGAFVTGTSALAARTGSDLFLCVAVVFYVLLVAAWAVVSARSLAHAAAHARSGRGGRGGRRRR